MAANYYARNDVMPCPGLVRRTEDWWERYIYHTKTWESASFELAGRILNTGDWTPIRDDVAAALIEGFEIYGYGPGPLIGGPTFSDLEPPENDVKPQ